MPDSLQNPPSKRGISNRLVGLCFKKSVLWLSGRCKPCSELLHRPCGVPFFRLGKPQNIWKVSVFRIKSMYTEARLLNLFAIPSPLRVLTSRFPKFARSPLRTPPQNKLHASNPPIDRSIKFCDNSNRSADHTAWWSRSWRRKKKKLPSQCLCKEQINILRWWVRASWINVNNCPTRFDCIQFYYIFADSTTCFGWYPHPSSGAHCNCNYIWHLSNRICYRPLTWRSRNGVQRSVLESNWNVLAHGDAREGKWRGNWRNGVGSQYSSHYFGTWCIQHYYRWCAHLGWQ